MDSRWLKKQFEIHPHKSKADLARAIGLEPPAVSKILKGTRQIKAMEYTEMRRFFGLPVDGEKALRTSNNAYVIEPLTNKKDGFDDLDGMDSADWIIPSDVVARRIDTPSGQVKIHEVKDTMMEPEFRRGEHLLINVADVNPSPPGAFVVSDGFGYLVRQCEYVPNSDPPKIKLSAKGKNFEPQILSKEEFQIIGRVVAKLQWL